MNLEDGYDDQQSNKVQLKKFLNTTEECNIQMITPYTPESSKRNCMYISKSPSISVKGKKHISLMDLPKTTFKRNKTHRISEIQQTANQKVYNRNDYNKKHHRDSTSEEISLIEVPIINQKTSPTQSNDNIQKNFKDSDFSSVEKAKLLVEIEALKAELSGKQVELDTIHHSLEASQLRVLEIKKDFMQQIKFLEKMLHSDYSIKHEQKIRALHLEYEDIVRTIKSKSRKRMESKIRKLEESIERERKEKNELIRVVNEYLQLEVEETTQHKKGSKKI